MILHEWEFGHRRTHREMMRRTFMFSPGQRQMHQCDLEKWLVTYLNILVSCATKLGALWSPVGWSTLRCAVVEKELCITPLTVLMGVDYQGIRVFLAESDGWLLNMFQVQVEVIQKRQKEKKAMMNAVKKYQKGTEAIVCVIDMHCFIWNRLF